jgi:hypothetical protein
VPVAEGLSDGSCTDGYDNDGNGTMDCADPGCAAAAPCVSDDATTTDSATGTSTATGNNGGGGTSTSTGTGNNGGGGTSTSTEPALDACVAEGVAAAMAEVAGERWTGAEGHSDVPLGTIDGQWLRMTPVGNAEVVERSGGTGTATDGPGVSFDVRFAASLQVNEAAAPFMFAASVWGFDSGPCEAFFDVAPVEYAVQVTIVDGPWDTRVSMDLPPANPYTVDDVVLGAGDWATAQYLYEAVEADMPLLDPVPPVMDAIAQDVVEQVALRVQNACFGTGSGDADTGDAGSGTGTTTGTGSGGFTDTGTDFDRCVTAGVEAAMGDLADAIGPISSSGVDFGVNPNGGDSGGGTDTGAARIYWNIDNQWLHVEPYGTPTVAYRAPMNHGWSAFDVSIRTLLAVNDASDPFFMSGDVYDASDMHVGHAECAGYFDAVSSDYALLVEIPDSTNGTSVSVNLEATPNAFMLWSGLPNDCDNMQALFNDMGLANPVFDILQMAVGFDWPNELLEQVTSRVQEACMAPPPP